MLSTNFIRNRIDDLKRRIDALRRAFDYSVKKNKLQEVNVKLKQSNLWKNPTYFHMLSKEYSSLESIINTLDKITKESEDIVALIKLAVEANDKELFHELILELNQLEEKLTQIEFRRMFSGKQDHGNCYLDIQAGSGGTEAQDWASMLIRMYLRWVETHAFRAEIIEESKGEIVGIKSITVKISGNYAYGWLRTETGIHRLVRKSPFDSNKRRHTSFGSVFVYPEINKNIDVQINQTDLRIDVYRSSGAGGQHVNRTESAVRITHIPTGLVTQCQSDRSQHKNKDRAMKQMKIKLYKLEIQKQNTEKQAIEDTKSDIGWGNQIRSYILDDSRIKDLRTGIEIRDIQSVLNGGIDRFIIESLKMGL